MVFQHSVRRRARCPLSRPETVSAIAPRGRCCRSGVPSFSRIKAGRANMYTCGRTLTQHTRRVTKLGNRRLSPQKHAPSGTPG